MNSAQPTIKKEVIANDIHQELQIQESVSASTSTTGLKHFIIGRLWTKSINGTKPGTLKISRSLPTNIILKPGTSLFLSQPNAEDSSSADFNVSILLPAETSAQLIIAKRAISAKRYQ